MARIMWVLSLLLATLAFSAAAASSSSSSSWPPTPSVDCDGVILDMMGCLAYVSKGSKWSRPDKACCQGLSRAVKLSQTCLCVALEEAIYMGLDLDMKRAAALPAACSIKVSVGDCGIKPPPPSVPGPAPSPEPTPAPPSPPKVTPTPPPPPKKPTPLPPPPHSPSVPPPHSPAIPPSPHSPAIPPPHSPPSKTPPSPASPPSTQSSPAPAPVESGNESSAARSLPVYIMTLMFALVVATCS